VNSEEWQGNWDIEKLENRDMQKCRNRNIKKWGKTGGREMVTSLESQRTRSGFHWAKLLMAENKKVENLLWNIIF
jgi:hypothetical protein